MKVYSLEEIRSSFFVDDLKHWSPPDLNRFAWQDMDYLAWPHPRAGSFFVCIETEQGLVGSVFEMNAGAGRNQVSCGLCYASNQEIGAKSAMIATASNPRRKIGIHVCADLACHERVRGQRPALFQYETISVGRRIERLQQKLGRIAAMVRDNVSH